MDNFEKNELESIFVVLVTEVALQHCSAIKTTKMSLGLFRSTILILGEHNY